MTMPTLVPEPVTYRGEPFTLAGRDLRVRYTMRSLLFIEERFGSITAMQEQISRGSGGPILTIGLDLLAAGLLHEHDGAGAPLTREELVELVDPRTIGEVLDMCGRALQAAFPQPDPAQEASGSGSASPGPTGSTSAPSPAA